MKRTSIALLALVSVASASIAAEPIYLACRYDLESMSARKILITLDLTARKLRWEDFYDTGKNDDVYLIQSASDSEVLATSTKPGRVLTLQLNRVNGRWLLQTPVHKSENKHLDFPEDLQLTGSIGGWCEPAKHKF